MVAHDVLPSYFNEADLYVSSSYSDGTSVSLLEAMACGRPVIAYKKGGVQETVKPGVIGEFFSEQSKDSLISVLKEFSHGKYNKEDCRKQAEKFDLKTFNERIARFVAGIKS